MSNLQVLQTQQMGFKWQQQSDHRNHGQPSSWRTKRVVQALARHATRSAYMQEYSRSKHRAGASHGCECRKVLLGLFIHSFSIIACPWDRGHKGSTGAYPNCHRAKAGWRRWQAATSLQGHIQSQREKKKQICTFRGKMARHLGWHPL